MSYLLAGMAALLNDEKLDGTSIALAARAFAFPDRDVKSLSRLRLLRVQRGTGRVGVLYERA